VVTLNLSYKIDRMRRPSLSRQSRILRTESVVKMSKNTAIVVQKPGDAKAAEVTIPKLRDDYIIVKVKAVALNPTDWKHIDFMASNGARVSDSGAWVLGFGPGYQPFTLSSG
jgi:hypothetical protein